MTHERFSDQDDWELEDDSLDIRGWNVVDGSGQQVGVVVDLLVDVETETIDAIVLDHGGEMPLAQVHVGDGEVRLMDSGGAFGTSSMGTDRLGSDLDGDADLGDTAGGLRGTTGFGGSTSTSDLDDAAGTTGFGGSSGATDTGHDTWRIRRHEEQLGARTRREQAGEVRVDKDVVEETRSIDVPVTHEEVEIRRVATDRPADDASVIDTGDSIRVPLTAETVDVVKEARVVEELEISKRPVTETRRVEDTVRREEIDIEPEGDVRVAGETPSDFTERRSS